MSLHSLIPVIGTGRVGKESGLMTCMQPGKGRSFTQVAGNMSRAHAKAVPCELRDAGTQRPAWDTFAAEDTVLKMVGVRAPSDIFKFLFKRAKFLRLVEIQTDEMVENGVWFDPMRTLRRNFDNEWTQEKKNCARHSVINGAVSKDAMCKYGWVQK